MLIIFSFLLKPDFLGMSHLSCDWHLSLQDSNPRSNAWHSLSLCWPCSIVSSYAYAWLKTIVIPCEDTNWVFVCSEFVCSEYLLDPRQWLDYGMYPVCCSYFHHLSRWRSCTCPSTSSKPTHLAQPMNFLLALAGALLVLGPQQWVRRSFILP